MRKLRHDVARRDHYEELTNTIIAKLEDGVLPWCRVALNREIRASSAIPLHLIVRRILTSVSRLQQL